MASSVPLQGNLENARVQDVHLLPCEIAYSGTANVAAYFHPEARDEVVDGQQVHEVTFRGRGLTGARVPIPEGYVGAVVEMDHHANARNDNNNTDNTSSSSGVANVVCRFDHLHYWNHDRIPSSIDPVPQALDFLSTSQAIHTPISPEQVARKQEALAAHGSL